MYGSDTKESISHRFSWSLLGKETKNHEENLQMHRFLSKADRFEDICLPQYVGASTSPQFTPSCRIVVNTS